VENKIRFQGQEHIDDLNLGWDSFKWRNHDPTLGRFFNVDPLAEEFVYNSTYAFAENSVIRYRELEGLEKIDFMVALYEPNKQPNGGYPLYSSDPTFNESPKDVTAGTSDQDLEFRIDLETGKLTLGFAQDRDKHFLVKAWDHLTTGDAHHLDYTLEAAKESGSWTIKGSINDVSFQLVIIVADEEITIESGMTNVDEEKGAVIKAIGSINNDEPSEAYHGYVVHSGHAEAENDEAKNRQKFTYKITDSTTELQPKQ
jgi:RHS repeat-associated protein